MKLSQFDTKTKATEGVEMELSDPITGEPTNVFITVRGYDSNTFQAAKLELERKTLEAYVIRGKTSLTQEDRVELHGEALSTVVIGWRNLTGDDDQPLPFSDKAAQEVMKNYPPIFEQVDAFVHTRKNFLKA